MTRGSNIERSAFVDCGTVVEDASVLPSCYVGAGLDVTHAVVGFRRIAHLNRKIEIGNHQRILIARRLRRMNRDSLADATRHGGPDNALELAALMLDRIGLVAMRLNALPPETPDLTDEELSRVEELYENNFGLREPSAVSGQQSAGG